jgi:hypothetical protein
MYVFCPITTLDFSETNIAINNYLFPPSYDPIMKCCYIRPEITRVNYVGYQFSIALVENESIILKSYRSQLP